MNEKESRRRLVIGAGGLLLMVAVTASVLRQLGQVGWCACGSPVPWSWDIWSSHNSQHAVDPYTFSHVLHGLILYYLLRFLPGRLDTLTRWLLAISLECSWEILENSPVIIERYRESTISLDYFGDSVTNSVCDILACGLGYLIAARLGWKKSLVLLVAIELLLVVTIRDCLFLNIVMLVYPIEAIRQWQM